MTVERNEWLEHLDAITRLVQAIKGGDGGVDVIRALGEKGIDAVQQLIAQSSRSSSEARAAPVADTVEVLNRRLFNLRQQKELAERIFPDTPILEAMGLVRELAKNAGGQ